MVDPVQPDGGVYEWYQRGKGLMLALEMVVPGSIRPDAAAATALLEATKRRGLLIGKGGLYGNVVRIAPSMLITTSEIEDGVKRMERALAEVQ